MAKNTEIQKYSQNLKIFLYLFDCKNLHLSFIYKLNII